MSTFQVGQAVRKVTGDYQLDGEVRAVFTTKAGKVRYVVEHVPGFLHIYAETNLQALSTEPPEHDALSRKRWWAENWKGLAVSLQGERDTARLERDEARMLFVRFSRHKDGCSFNSSNPCTCGVKDIVSEWRKMYEIPRDGGRDD